MNTTLLEIPVDALASDCSSAKNIPCELYENLNEKTKMSCVVDKVIMVAFFWFQLYKKSKNY